MTEQLRAGLASPELQWACDIPPRFGRVLSICSHRGDVLIACEFGLLKLTEEFATGSFRVQPMKVETP